MLYHGAIVRYIHDRDKDSVELQLLRMRAIINFYDLDGGSDFQKTLPSFLPSEYLLEDTDGLLRPPYEGGDGRTKQLFGENLLGVAVGLPRLAYSKDPVRVLSMQ